MAVRIFHGTKARSPTSISHFDSTERKWIHSLALVGLAWLPDGRLGISTWDRDGAVYALGGWQNAAESVVVERIAEGLHEPLGLAVVDDELYVMQKQEITRLIDHDDDGWIDEYRTLANDWRATSNFHEFGFGLVSQDEYLYGGLSVCVMNGGKSCRDQTSDRGKIFRVLSPNRGTGILGEWIQNSERLGSFAERRAIRDRQPRGLVACKQADSNFEGRILRLARSRRPAGLWSGRTSDALASPERNRKLSDTAAFSDPWPLRRACLVWRCPSMAESNALSSKKSTATSKERPSTLRPGYERRSIVCSRRPAVVSSSDKSEVTATGANMERIGMDSSSLASQTKLPSSRSKSPRQRKASTSISVDPWLRIAEVSPDHFTIVQWFYIPSDVYGGPKYDITRALGFRSSSFQGTARGSRSRSNGLKAERIVYLKMDRRLRSEAGESLWVNEAWYTLTKRPSRIANRASSSPVLSENSLTPAEQAKGWRLLFDGKTFDGWKIYGAEDDTIEGWTIEDQAFKFIRDVSFAGLIWNHVSPFRTAAIDLMTKDRFENFELSIDWKISEGGNSGIFYFVPNEEASLPWTYGVEMQVLDDLRHSDGQLDRRRAGDLYDIKASTRSACETSRRMESCPHTSRERSHRAFPQRRPAARDRAW